eukprot:SAG31_NODE_29760_length_390_cov_0.862543_1_plen_123_part_01
MSPESWMCSHDHVRRLPPKKATDQPLGQGLLKWTNPSYADSYRKMCFRISTRQAATARREARGDMNIYIYSNLRSRFGVVNIMYKYIFGAPPQEYTAVPDGIIFFKFKLPPPPPRRRRTWLDH